MRTGGTFSVRKEIPLPLRPERRKRRQRMGVDSGMFQNKENKDGKQGY